MQSIATRRSLKAWFKMNATVWHLRELVSMALEYRAEFVIRRALIKWSARAKVIQRQRLVGSMAVSSQEFRTASIAILSWKAHSVNLLSNDTFPLGISSRVEKGVRGVQEG